MPFGSGVGDKYESKQIPFEYAGIDTTVPVNFLPSTRYPFGRNIRCYDDGRISTRPGITALSTGHGPNIHSIARLNDPTTASAIYIVGTGTTIKAGIAGLAQVDTGYSGLPFLHITHRPERSPAPLLYLTEGTKMSKFDVLGTAFKWGIFPPSTPPSIAVSAPPGMISISDFTSANPEVTPENGNVWNKSVNAFSLTQVNRTNTTIATILYDTGTTGFCNIIPTAMGTDIQPDQRIFVQSAEYVLVLQTFPAIVTTTIESISYNSGSTGLCTIQLSTPTTGLLTNTIVNLNNGGTNEYVRVLSVTNGPDNKPCFRCVTVATYAAGNTVTGFKNFRTYTTATRSAGNTLVTKAYESIIDYGFNDPAIPGIANVRHNIALDLSNVGGRPLSNADELSVGVFIDDINKLIYGRVWIDIDPNTTTSYNAMDLSRNYYFYEFRKEDLQAYADKTNATSQLTGSFGNIQASQIDAFNTRSALATARDPLTGQIVSLDDLQKFRQQIASNTSGIIRKNKSALLQKYNELLGNVGQGGGLFTAPVTPSGDFQAQSGREQWYQLRIKIGDLNRVGTDQSLSLKNSTSFMVNFNVTADSTVRISSAWIGGSFGPDTKTDSDVLGNAYYYRYLARNSETAEIGIASPPTRAGVIPRLQQVTLTIPFYDESTAANPQIDKLDIYRYGGSLLQWTYIGTVDNTNPNITFTDNFSDEVIANNPILRFDNFPPVPTADLPKTGVCNVVGTRLIRTSGDLFNLNWSPGTEVIINGKTFLTYAQPETTSIVELTESAGTVASGAFEIPNALIMGNPLPAVWGPYGQGISGLTYFFVGDTNNPGVLYWTNGNDANSCSDLNFLEITSPSEPLIGGCIYDGRPYVFSSEKMFLISQNPNAGVGESQFLAQEVANSKGLWTRTALCVDTLIYFVSKDGIYVSEGGQPRSITDETLFNLFPHEGLPGVTPVPLVDESIEAPVFTNPTYWNLFSDGQFVHFIYPNAGGLWRMLIWDKVQSRWFYDIYGDGGVRAGYADQGKQVYGIKFGTASGAFATRDSSGMFLDIGEQVTVKLLTFAFDADDSRARHRWGDIMLDFSTNGNDPLQVRVFYDNFNTLIRTVLLSAVGRERQIIDLDSGDETLDLGGVNVGLEFTYTACGNQLDLYEWRPYWVAKPEDVFLRATDWFVPNELGAYELQGITIEADTQGTDRVINLEGSELGLIQQFTINHTRQITRSYALTNPVIDHSFRLRPSDVTDFWRLFNIKWTGNSAPPNVLVYETQYTDHDMPGWKHLREGWITLISSGTVTLTITVDGLPYVYTIPSTSGVQTKIYLPIQAVKFKLVKYRFEASANFRLYLRDSWVSVGMWGRSETAYQALQPFGGMSRETGALI